MIGMKIEFTDNKIIVYLYQYTLNFNDLNILNKEIKQVFMKLVKKYKINFFGYSEVRIYNNDKYGNILEIEKIYDNNEFNINTIDLKIIVYKNVPMYLEFNNFYFTKMPKHLIIKDNKYYIDINNIKNIIKYVEYGRINYKENS